MLNTRAVVNNLVNDPAWKDHILYGKSLENQEELDALREEALRRLSRSELESAWDLFRRRISHNLGDVSSPIYLSNLNGGLNPEIEDLTQEAIDQTRSDVTNCHQLSRGYQSAVSKYVDSLRSLKTT